jgi:hypothetical protein
VSISQCKKDETHGRGLIGVVFAVSVYGGCCVVTKQGIIGHEKGFHWIPVDRYKALSDDMPIEETYEKYVLAFWKMSLNHRPSKKFLL